MDNNNIFFVYLLLDPRKPVLQPFYAGKGTRYRDTDHLRPSAQWKSQNKLKNRVIARIRQAGLKPVVYRYAENLTEQEAFALERDLIARFGRRNLGKGILTNLTDGGEGVSGYLFTEERKAQYREKFSGENNPMYGRERSEDERAKISQTRKERLQAGLIVQPKHTEEHKQSLRNDVERRRKNGFGKAARRVLKIHPTEGNVDCFPTTIAFAEAMGWATNTNVSQVASAGCLPRGGFFYRYEDSEDVIDGMVINASELLHERSSSRSNSAKKVGAFQSNVLERTYLSVTDAAQQTGISYHRLWRAIANERSIDGLEWRYVG